VQAANLKGSAKAAGRAAEQLAFEWADLQFAAAVQYATLLSLLIQTLDAERWLRLEASIAGDVVLPAEPTGGYDLVDVAAAELELHHLR
jgi:hypothetical protein